MSRRANGAGAINADGYVVICRDYQYKYEHVWVAEKAVGRSLPKGAVVHHVDGNPANNTPSNLVVCPSAKYHRLLHRRTDALNACGNPDFVVCRYCGSYGDPRLMTQDGIRSMAHRECRAAARRAAYKPKTGWKRPDVSERNHLKRIYK